MVSVGPAGVGPGQEAASVQGVILLAAAFAGVACQHEGIRKR